MIADRLIAFTDGVFAIIITIMVLELHVPATPILNGLIAEAPLFFAYALSFVMIGIYWSNHHHLFKSVRLIGGEVMWANLFLLFWLSLFPLIIRWAGEAGITAYPIAAYALIMSMAGLAYFWLERALIRVDPDSPVGSAVKGHGKELASVALDLAALGMAFVWPLLSIAALVGVAAMWLVPDRRFSGP